VRSSIINSGRTTRRFVGHAKDVIIVKLLVIVATPFGIDVEVDVVVVDGLAVFYFCGWGDNRLVVVVSVDMFFYYFTVGCSHA